MAGGKRARRNPYEPSQMEIIKVARKEEGFWRRMIIIGKVRADLAAPVLLIGRKEVARRR